LLEIEEQKRAGKGISFWGDIEVTIIGKRYASHRKKPPKYASGECSAAANRRGKCFRVKYGIISRKKLLNIWEFVELSEKGT